MTEENMTPSTSIDCQQKLCIQVSLLGWAVVQNMSGDLLHSPIELCCMSLNWCLAIRVVTRKHATWSVMSFGVAKQMLCLVTVAGAQGWCSCCRTDIAWKLTLVCLETSLSIQESLKCVLACRIIPSGTWCRQCLSTRCWTTTSLRSNSIQVPLWVGWIWAPLNLRSCCCLCLHQTQPSCTLQGLNWLHKYTRISI